MGAPARGAVVLVRFPFSDLSQSKLSLTSYVRSGKLFTANTDLVHSEVGMLTPDALTRVVDAVVALLRPTPPPVEETPERRSAASPRPHRRTRWNCGTRVRVVCSRTASTSASFS